MATAKDEAKTAPKETPAEERPLLAPRQERVEMVPPLENVHGDSGTGQLDEPTALTNALTNRETSPHQEYNR